MDVRCERCETEYELEDETVTEGGVPVQCTSCGHTFFVTRPGTTGATKRPPAPAPAEAELAPADWLLETADGQLHRFRNLTSLQKWIIERKVTRDDKISRTGHAWRRLAEIVELAPFFDVVDEADRARAAEAAARELKVEAEQARRVGPRPSPVRGLAAASGPHELRPERLSPVESGPTAPRRTPASNAATPVRPYAAFPPEATPSHSPPASFADLPGELSTHVVRVRPTGFVLLAFLILGGVAAVLLTRSPWIERALAAMRGGRQHAPSAEPPIPSTPVASNEPAEEPAVTAPPAPAPEPAVAAAPTPSAPAAEAPAPTYEALVGQADRALENGATDRASKLYTNALKLRPNGVEAVAGLGYAALDRGRTAQAVGLFRRALSRMPSYGPALFGQAEAHRAQGLTAEALEEYRAYLQRAPNGNDRPAAERQIKALESRLAAAGSSSGEAPAKEPAKDKDPGPLVSPSSVLGESAAPAR